MSTIAEVCQMARDAKRVFGAYRDELRDLNPTFWVALESLADLTEFNTRDEICSRFLLACRYLGAPGDFGYGTPCGDALRRLYEARQALEKGDTNDNSRETTQALG